MRAYQWMVGAVLAFFCACLLVLQVALRDDAPPSPAAKMAVAPAPGPPGAIAPIPPPVSAAAGATPLPPAGRDRELALNECVERRAHAAGVDRIAPTLPGRWPAIKRAREVQRLKRLELRGACEGELARQ